MLTAHITTLSSTKKYTSQFRIELIQMDPVKDSLQKNYSCISNLVHWPSTRPWHMSCELIWIKYLLMELGMMCNCL